MQIIRPNFSSLVPTQGLSQSVTPAASLLKLGVTFDENFNFKQHISNTCRCYFYHIRDHRYIRRYISLSWATALISLDYCNPLHCNSANKDIAILPRAHNCLARVVTRSPRFSRSVLLLKSLHWMPVHYYFPDLCSNLSSPLVNTTSTSEFSARPSMTFQTATINQ